VDLQDVGTEGYLALDAVVQQPYVAFTGRWHLDDKVVRGRYLTTQPIAINYLGAGEVYVVDGLGGYDGFALDLDLAFAAQPVAAAHCVDIYTDSCRRFEEALSLGYRDCRAHRLKGNPHRGLAIWVQSVGA
jgi:hypothetical protein